MRTYLASFLPVAMLAACGGADQGAADEPAAVERNTSGSGAGLSTDGPTALETSIAASAGDGGLSAADLPLTPGVYTRVGAPGDAPSCPPAMASVATFNGEGFGGRNSTGCKFDPTRKDGSTWSGTQTCTDTYTQTERTENLSVTVQSQTRYTQESRFGTAMFELCPNEKLSDWGG